jgi:hypothetical protein
MVIRIVRDFFKRVFNSIFRGKTHLSIGFYGPPNAGDLPTFGDCEFDFEVTNDCDNSGFIFKTWTVKWTGDPDEIPSYCADGSDEIKCLSSALLGFFSIVSLIMVIFITIIFYVIRGKKNEM